MIEIEDGSMALGVKVQNREGEKERDTHMRPSQRFWFGVKSETRSATDGEGRRAQRQNNPDSGRTFFLRATVAVFGSQTSQGAAVHKCRKHVKGLLGLVLGDCVSGTENGGIRQGRTCGPLIPGASTHVTTQVAGCRHASASYAQSDCHTQASLTSS